MLKIILSTLIFKRKSRQNIVKIDQNGRCRQVFTLFGIGFEWPLVVVDRWSLFRGRFRTKNSWVGFGVVVVDRGLLFGGGRIHKFDFCNKKRNVDKVVSLTFGSSPILKVTLIRKIISSLR